MEELNSDGLPILKGNKNFTADGLPILKKKDQSTASLTGGVGSAPGLEPFQQFKPGVNKYVRQPAPIPVARRNQGPAPQTVAQAQKEKPVPLSSEAFKQNATQGPSPSAANWMGAITSTASGIYRIPKLVYDTFAIPQNLAADILDKPELKANYDAISKGTYNPLGVIDKTADYLQQSSADWEKNKRKYDENITSQLMNGDFKGAAMQIGDQIESSIPGMLSMYLTGPAAAAAKFGPTARTLTMAAPFSGSQLNQIKDNPGIPDYLKPVNAWLNGTAEVVLEEQFGTKSLVDDALRISKTEGREAAVETIKNVLRPLGERFIKKVQPITNIVGNGLEEGITTLSQNIIDKYTGVDPNRGIFDGVSDAVIVGSAQGAGATALGKGMDVLTNPKNQVKIDALSKQRDDLMNDLDSPSIPDNIKGDLVDKLSDINEQINTVLDENRAEYDALSDDDIFTLKKLNDQIDDKVDLLNNTSLSETSRQLADNDLSILQKELAAKQKDVSTKVKQFKTKANAVQEPSTTGQVPPVIEGGQNIQEGGEGVGQSIQGTQAPQEVTIQEPTAEISPEEEVARLREQEQQELAEAIPNIEQYKVDGKVDKSLITDPKALKKYNKVYDKYDKLITPLIRETKQVEATTTQQPKQAIVSGVKYTVPTIEQQDALKTQRTDKAYFDAKVNELPSSPLTSEQVDEVLTNGQFGILTGQNPMGQPVPDAVNNKLNTKAKKWLKSKGYTFFDVAGKYGQTEGSLLVPNLTNKDAIEFAKEFNQESVVTNDGLVYQDGSINPRVKEEDSFTVDVSQPDADFASAIKLSDGLVKGFSIGLNFDETVNAPEVKQKAEVKVEETQDLASKIRTLKINLGKGTAQSNIAGLPIALYNSVVETVALFVEAGSTISEAIDKAVKKYNLDKVESFNKSELTKNIQDSAKPKRTKSVKDIDVNKIRTQSRPGNRVSKGLAVKTVSGEKIVEESDTLSTEYVKNNAPKIFISNAEKLSKYPIVSGIKKFGEIKTEAQAQEVYDIFIRQVADNLKYLTNEYNPVLRDISTLWYDGLIY